MCRRLALLRNILIYMELLNFSEIGMLIAY